METELRSAAGDTAQGTAPQTGQAPEALSTVPGQTSPRNDLAKKKKSAMKRRETIFLVCILALPVLNWLIFWLSVNVSSFILAFQDNAGNWSFINFTLFWNQLTSPYGDTVGMAILNTLKYFAVNLLLIFPLTLIMSYFIYKRVAGYRAFRVIFFLPAIISGIVLVSVYSNMISPTGPIGALLKAMGVQMPEEGYLLNPDTATPAILIYCIWTGFTTNLIIISSAMSRIPVEVLESARLDGCSSFKELIFLILPMIWSSVSTLVIFILTGIFSPPTLAIVYPWLLALSALTAFVAWRVHKRWRQSGPAEGFPDEDTSNPLEFKVALIFALLFMVFTVVTHYTLLYAGQGGLTVLSFVAGLSDITPFILNLLQGTGNVATDVVAACTLQAIASNVAVNMAYALFFAGRANPLSRWVWRGFAVVVAANVALLAVFYLLH